MSNVVTETETVYSTPEAALAATTAETPVEAPKRKRGRPRVLTDEQRIEHRKAAAKKYQASRRQRHEETVAAILATLSEVNISRLNKESQVKLAEVSEQVKALQVI